ncbi:MAG TPA: hypothetical protein VLV78_17315 [Thermoanaerobaculia bacterium]|nr:hypothetical protein [Thermoanaerobaculia bacterium]
MRRAIAVICLIALTGCTTVANGPMQRVYVDSNPDGAVVRLTHCGAFATKAATTPAVVWVSRRSTQCELTFAMPERAEQRTKLSRHVSRHMSIYGTTAEVILDGSDSIGEWFIAGTLLLLPSFVIDAATGSMFELQPNEAHADFTRPQRDWRDQ